MYDLKTMKARFDDRVNTLKSKKAKNHQLFTKDEYENLLAKVNATKKKISHKTPEEYQRLSRYDIVAIGHVEKLVVPRKNETDPIIYYTFLEETFNIIHETHLSIGHGGRNRMIKELKTKYKNITAESIMIYLNLCELCRKKMNLPKKELVLIERPIKGRSEYADEVYQSKWFALKNLQFLWDKDKPRKTKSTIPTDRKSSPESEKTTDERDDDDGGDQAQEKSDTLNGNNESPLLTTQPAPRPLKKKRRLGGDRRLGSPFFEIPNFGASTSKNYEPELNHFANTIADSRGKNQSTPLEMKKKCQQTRQLDKAFEIPNSCASSSTNDDESQDFGNLVAKKLRRYDHLTRCSVQNKIMGIFLNADRVFYSQNHYAPPPPTPLHIQIGPPPQYNYSHANAPSSPCLLSPAVSLRSASSTSPPSLNSPVSTNNASSFDTKPQFASDVDFPSQE